MKRSHWMISALLLCLAVPIAAAYAEGSPKQILEETPDKIKEGVEKVQQGFKQEKPERDANMKKTKQDIKDLNPFDKPKPETKK